ncbi:transcription termination factor, RNA polymerase II, partial [Ceratobasidium sp. 370]
MKGPHPECTIILVEALSLQASGRAVLLTAGDRAWAEPSTGHLDNLRNTFFSRDLLLAVLEEAHGYRNWNPNHRTMLTFMSRASQMVVLMATPVHMHPHDLLSLGQLTRSPRFVGSRGAELTKNVEQKFKESNKAWDSERKQELLRQFLLSLRGYNMQLASESGDASCIVDLLPQQEDDIASYRAFWGAREGLYMLCAALEDILIRRDECSKDIAGNPLLNLLPKIELMSYIKLDAQTEEALSAETATKEARNLARMDLDSFFTRLKKILVHVKLMEDHGSDVSAEEHMGKLFPNLAAYWANSSPKLDWLVRILQYHQGDKNMDAPPLSWSQDGDSKWRKFVVYCHLSQSWTLVAHVLKLSGIETLRVNGSMEPVQRDLAVRSFQSEQGPDVMLLSDAGAQGLKLQRGLIDHPWSASEAQQIDGWVQRHGQNRQVIVYRLMAPGTPDEYLLGYADGKRLMMQVFTQECVTRGCPGFEHEDRDPNEEEISDGELESSTQAQRKPRKTKVTSRGLKSDAALPGRSTQEVASSTDPPAVSKPTPKSGKPKPERFFHPDYPKLGARPREAKGGLAACQTQCEVKDKVVQATATSSTSVKPNECALGSKVAGASATEAAATKAPATDKGKGKAGEIQAVDLRAQASDSLPHLTVLQANMFSMLCRQMITLEQVQQILQMQNEPPLLSSILPASAGPEAASSSTAPPPSPIASSNPITPSPPATPTPHTNSTPPAAPTSLVSPIVYPAPAHVETMDAAARSVRTPTPPAPTLATTHVVSPTLSPRPRKRVRKDDDRSPPPTDPSFKSTLATSTPQQWLSPGTHRPHSYDMGTQQGCGVSTEETTIPEMDMMDPEQERDPSPPAPTSLTRLQDPSAIPELGTKATKSNVQKGKEFASMLKLRAKGTKGGSRT